MLPILFPASANALPSIDRLADFPNDDPKVNQALNNALAEVSNSDKIVEKMTLKEKIGQKIMLDFRFWWEDNLINDKQDMVLLTETIRNIIWHNHIGGIILFANNLKNKEQIQKLTEDLRGTMTAEGIPLFIAIDNEGGSVFRLPRGEFSSFSGNMALGAAMEGRGENELAYKQGCVMARDVLSLGINTLFAPVMDVNNNQNNPVINVRSFGDDPATVSLLARKMIGGIGSKNVVSVAKHFPGHGDTVTDSHLGLPVVTKSRQDAHDIDLAPYRDAITSGEAPDMIMTAHIQYPALDDTKVKNKGGEEIILPATLSKKIQTDLLRGELGFKGVTITDALDMKAISDNFHIHTVMEEIFKAGVDIALMPLRVYCAEDEFKLKTLINYLAKKITEKVIDEKAITASVSRIIDLKLEKNIIAPVRKDFSHDVTLSRTLEKEIADSSVTLLKNDNQVIPLKEKSQNIYILMPWAEQSAAIEYTLRENGYHSVRSEDSYEKAWLRKLNIKKYDILIIGNMSDRVSEKINVAGSSKSPDPSSSASSEKDKIQEAINIAKAASKKVIYLSLKAPYDVANYHDKADAVLATYSFYGSDKHNQRGMSLNAATEVIIGKLSAKGGLPVNIYNVDSLGHTAGLLYPRGFGLTS
ncbi:glycoside hydrolase family 3 protein [Sodalis sp. dw_96]|uniref:glycoside hydrolase family 3 protein n=1 Tax=Sodalis sp. dw_96 TaxID=2719794 RepID=UPI001BD346AB|nr:glycoside hydrolase family 3 protein [Sodalis sp. dw_96]